MHKMMEPIPLMVNDVHLEELIQSMTNELEK